jgi:hypothetical protein
MKIQNTSNNLIKYGQFLEQLVANKNLSFNKPQTFRKLRPSNHFIAWPSCPKRHISFISGLSSTPHLDLNSLENFLKRQDSPEHIEDLNFGPALEKAIALKKMTGLIHETLSTMKALTHLKKSIFKG